MSEDFRNSWLLAIIIAIVVFMMAVGMKADAIQTGDHLTNQDQE